MKELPDDIVGPAFEKYRREVKAAQEKVAEAYRELREAERDLLAIKEGGRGRRDKADG